MHDASALQAASSLLQASLILSALQRIRGECKHGVAAQQKPRESWEQYIKTRALVHAGQEKWLSAAVAAETGTAAKHSHDSGDAAAARPAATTTKATGAVRGPRSPTARRAAAAAATRGPGCNNGHGGARGLGEICGIANGRSF